MEQKLYSVEEVAQFLDLHPKTVRRFIREGRIKARKIGRSWKVSQDDFKAYAHGELVVPEKIRKAGEKRITVSTVIEIREGGSEEASRISNSLIALLNGKDPSWGKSRYDFFYHPETDCARFVLYGSPGFIAAVLKMFEVIMEQK